MSEQKLDLFELLRTAIMDGKQFFLSTQILFTSIFDFLGV